MAKPKASFNKASTPVDDANNYLLKFHRHTSAPRDAGTSLAAAIEIEMRQAIEAWTTANRPGELQGMGRTGCSLTGDPQLLVWCSEKLLNDIRTQFADRISEVVPLRVKPADQPAPPSVDSARPKKAPPRPKKKPSPPRGSRRKPGAGKRR